MKIAGIIAEYNPFHSGHALHIQKTREITGSNSIVCAMSGNFVQRGAPAVTDKWRRTEMALTCGADLVIELPFLYATQSAEGFASGGVRLLDALGCIDFLSFGSESGNLAALSDFAALLSEEPEALSCLLADGLDEGLSFPKARNEALRRFTENSDYATLLPNDILAVEYLKALRSIGSGIQPIAVKRQGGGYADASLHKTFSSASAIRHALAAGDAKEWLYGNIPPECAPLYDFDPLTDMKHFFRLLLFRLRSMSIDEISKIQDVTEGLEYRIAQCAKTAENLESLILGIKSKRYTYTRIARVLLYCLFGVTKQHICLTNEERPPYARVLGFRKDKENILSYVAAASNIPLLTKPSEFFEHATLQFDLRASDVYALLNQKIAPAGRDFTQKLIVI